MAFGAFDVFVEVHVEDIAVLSFSLGISSSLVKQRMPKSIIQTGGREFGF